MNSLKSGLALIFLVICTLACSDDDIGLNDNGSNEQLDPTVQYNLTNEPYGESNRQILDLYLPANRTSNTKVVILVHGGGWSSGSKQDMVGFRDFIVDELPKLAIANINYRLADQNNPPYPMQLNDITSVIEFLKTNREKFVIGDEYAMIGVSAGGHLALLWSYAFDSENNINMVCSLVGPTNLTDPNYTETEDIILSNVLNIFGPNATTEYLEQSSPYHQATSSAPPTILFYGGQDPLIPTSQGIDMRDRLNELGVINEFTLYPNAGHLWLGQELLDTSIKLKAFIETYL